MEIVSLNSNSSSDEELDLLRFFFFLITISRLMGLSGWSGLSNTKTVHKSSNKNTMMNINIHPLIISRVFFSLFCMEFIPVANKDDTLTIKWIWKPNYEKECKLLFNRLDAKDPFCLSLKNR